jgi:hypothetical protein
VELLAALEIAGLLVGTLVVGLVAHELSHFVALRLSGVPCTIEVLPKRDNGEGSAGIGDPLARVRPTHSMGDIEPRHLRVAALMPLCLSVPLVLVFVGVLPDPFAAGAVSSKLVLIAWLGCSIPSPQDFSMVWYPEEAIATAPAQTTS